MKDKILHALATTLSILLHPLLLPTYGLTIVAAGNLLDLTIEKSWLYYLIAVCGTFIFTFVIPFSMILILRRQQRVSSISLSERRERNAPYIYSFFSFAVWCYYLRVVLHLESVIFYVACAATVAIGLVALINLKWKISAHLTGWGCFIGAVMIVTSLRGGISNWFIFLLFLVALLLCYARIYLRSHTPAQVSAGLLLGLLLSSLTLLLI